MPLTMPKKRKAEQQPESRSEDRHKRPKKGYYFPEDLANALEAYVNSTEPRTTQTAVVVHALREFLRKVGYWPWPRNKEGGDQ